MRVAFATGDCEHVNEQLRGASHLVVYEVTAAGCRLDRTCAFASDARHGTDERIRAIAGSAIVYVSAIGPSGAARLAARGIRAATSPAGTRIRDLLADLCRMLAARDRRSGEGEGQEASA
jgi:nitrogen fixation protein NifX